MNEFEDQYINYQSCSTDIVLMILIEYIYIDWMNLYIISCFSYLKM